MSKPVVDAISATLRVSPSDNFVSIIARASLHHSVETIRAAIQKIYEPVVVEAMEIARPLNAIYARKEPASECSCACHGGPTCHGSRTLYYETNAS